tara:strand:- start:1240 stop:1476 length:237 start_codon:yes stop_codon:yes gene_type:complete
MTEDEIKSIIQYAIKQFGSEWDHHGHDNDVAISMNDIAKGEGNIRGIAQGLFLIGESLETISRTYSRELDAKLKGEIE